MWSIFCRPIPDLPGSLYGDLNGQINALELGIRRMNDLLDEYGDGRGVAGARLNCATGPPS